MFSRWLRLGIRTQIMIIVMIGTVLTTAVTLLIADTSIQNYGQDQIKAQETRNLKVAYLVLQTQFGHSVSISADNQMVIDSPDINKQNYTSDPTYGQYGKLPLNVQTAYVDQVHALLNGNEVSVFQCANQDAQLTSVNGQVQCGQISTTFLAYDAHGNLQTILVKDPITNQNFPLNRNVSTPNHIVALPQDAVAQMHIAKGQPQQWTGPETIGGTQYIVAYQPLLDPQQHLIGVLAVAEPLTAVTTLINNTTLELIISGVVIMVAGVILAVLVASTISGTLQRASTQLSTASNQLSGISGQQAGGSRQQVWAINAINQALRNLQEISADVSRRTDQLAQIGAQVAMRRAEIAPSQFESVMAYMTRSVRDISVASHQQTTTIERMSGAMQAVVEIADQVAGSSQHTSESAKRLDTVVGDLRQLVTGRGRRRAERQASARTSTPLAERSMQGGGQGRGPTGNMPMSGTSSRPRYSDAPMTPSRPNRSMPEAARSGVGYGASDGGNRPMLPPAPRRRQSSPGWDYDDQSSYQTGYGAQPPRSDYGRNSE